MDHVNIPTSKQNNGYQNDDPLTNMSNTLYISSSIFRNLNPTRLSTINQTAHVLFYLGADANRMLYKLKNDHHLRSLSNASKLFLLTGSNNIDPIYYGTASLQVAKHDILLLIRYLKHHFPHTKIYVLNILPREIKGRNDIVSTINTFIQSVCDQSAQLQYVDTFNNNLFTTHYGIRKSHFFKPGPDNVHLNIDGIIRLAKHLKFIAHQNAIQ